MTSESNIPRFLKEAEGMVNSLKMPIEISTFLEFCNRLLGKIKAISMDKVGPTSTPLRDVLQDKAKGVNKLKEQVSKILKLLTRGAGGNTFGTTQSTPDHPSGFTLHQTQGPTSDPPFEMPP
ncbi:hypothetical protein CR513_54834, partial [Mucuna pruriens]